MSDALDFFDYVDNADEPHVNLGTHKPRLGTHAPDLGDDVLGQVITIDDDTDALTLLDDSDAEPNFGVGTPDGDVPEFGTHAPQYGVSDSEDALSALSDDDAANEKSLDGMANAVFRDLDMVLDDDSDYGDDAPGETQIGQIDVEDDGGDALTLLDDSDAEPNFGVGTPDGDAPEFGTHAPQYGVSDSEDDQPFVAPVELEDEGDFFIGAQQDGEDSDPELDGMANAVFRNLDMVLDDDSDYGDDAPGETQIHGTIIGSDLLAIAIAAQESGFEPESLSEHALQQELTTYSAKRVAQGRPIIIKDPIEHMRDWQLDFGGFAPAGTIMNVYSTPQVLFRGEKIIATDSSTLPGNGTRIMAIAVGQKMQRPGGTGGTLTHFYPRRAMGNGHLWDTCQMGLTISVTVSFIQDCTFDMTVFGKCAL